MLIKHRLLGGGLCFVWFFLDSVIVTDRFISVLCSLQASVKAEGGWNFCIYRTFVFYSCTLSTFTTKDENRRHKEKNVP